MSESTAMRALVAQRVGEPADVLRLESRPAREPGKGQVVVRLHAAPIHASDLQILRRRYGYTPTFPTVLGSESVGVIEAVGPGVDTLGVLVARLRALLRRGATPRPRELRAGDLALDPVARRCRRGEVPIGLTRREYALLKALLRHAGEGATKVQLLREVWGEDFPGDDNVVEVYVGYLRRKIDAPFGRHSLQTVRGIGGYRLVADG
jgi:two-component system, OmpR family, response regulator